MLSFNIILWGLVLLILIGLTYQFSLHEGFDSGSHTKFIQESNRKLNALTNTINLTNPAIPIDPITTDLIHEATNVVLADPNSTTYSLSAKAPYSPPDQTPGAFQQAASCSEAPKTCAAFDDPTFAKNCGMSFDINGIGYDGRPFTGGLYVSPDDREQQTIKAKTVRDTGSAPYDPHQVYQPTLGKAKAGTFGLTKGQCIVVKEKLDCATKQTFNIPNCTQCYTSQSFSRVGPETGRLPSTLNLFGVGSVSVSSSNGTIAQPHTGLSKNKAIAITIPPTAEGTTFTINVSGPAPFYISGFIEGPTARGTFKLELMTLIQKDIITNAKPRISGTVNVGGFRCFTLMPGNGKTSMNLSCLIPFSFINMFDGDALACENGPIITNAASATFLESDPCFGKANSPGNYKLECLQSRWMELGGTMQGTGFPKDQASADAIQKDASGRPLSIDDIVDILAIKSAQAQTGTDATGKSLTIPDWNTVSMYMTGVPINTPCDGPNNAVGPLSRDCLSYLYTNKGVSSRIGNTYTQNPGLIASSKEGFLGNTDSTADGTIESVIGDAGDTLVCDADNTLVGDALEEEYLTEQFQNPPNTFNYPNTSIDPATATGKDFGQSLGGVAAVKQKYDDINRLANDNSKTNAERSQALLQAYGVQLGSPSSNRDDFDVRIPAGKSTNTYQDMKDFCESKGKRLCQSGEICDMATRTVMNPDLTSEFTTDNWIAVGDTPNEWLTLNRGGGRYCKTHTEVANGLPSWGDSRNPTTWERLAKCCDESPHLQGRYIRIQYDRPEYLNLGEIQVFSAANDRTGIIKPSMLVSKPSGWGGDVFPGRNFVDGNPNSFVHTSGGEVPWVVVDLGSIRPIYKIVLTNRRDCCLERVLGAVIMVLDSQMKSVYQSSPIRSVNQAYTFFPPSKNVYPDYNGEKPDPGFVSDGCWADTGDRALPIQEGTDPRLTGNYQTRADAIEKCYQVAKERNYAVFAVQHGGHCQGTTDTQGYKRFGRANNCAAGKGGGWANDVYLIGDNATATPKPTPTPWQCLPGMPTPMRKNGDGDVECMSFNARDCTWTSDAQCPNYIGFQNHPHLNPLVCGNMHTRQWGGPGYDNPGHWCARAKNIIKQ
jgi:hypothetical protein